ncbi:MAG: hypothetical protein ABIH34_06215 [Nanoarchaeota archaeon]
MKTHTPPRGKQRMFLKAEAILRYLTQDDEHLDTLIMCKGSEVELITSDASLYSAMASVEDHSKIKFNKLTKFLEVVDIHSSKERGQEKKVLTHEDVENLRKIALR